ncbi:MAG TPA: hypothetical protein VN361_12505, partial [Oxalicibacterium sp.]|nr:hypothetical protein [Oxalicibacterium sp.]
MPRFTVKSTFALVLDFSDNPSGESWKRIWSGEYSLNAGIEMSHGDSTFLVGDAVTLMPGSKTSPGTETITLSRGGNHLDRFNLRSFDVAMQWTGDPGVKPADFGDYFYLFMTAVNYSQIKRFHVDTWDTYAHSVLDDPMEAIFIGFRTDGGPE